MSKTASIYRMVMDKHICPYGLKAKDLLESRGYAVEDHHLKTRAQTDAFKEEHHVETTPQIFIGGARIGGYDALRSYFGKDAAADQNPNYTPVLVIFAVAFLMALAAGYAMGAGFVFGATLKFFIAFSMCILAVMKLRDLESFSLQFLGYDLLARRWVKYAYIYPFAEAFAGIGMISGAHPLLVAPVSLFIGSVGTVSVIKAVYIDKRELKCACVGGNSNVPLGSISLTENLMMAGMGLWMLLSL